MTEIVASTVSTAASPHLEREAALAPGTGRAIVIGTIAGFFVVGGFCAGIAALVGLPATASLALGAFTGFWGGPGFGGMMGFVLHESKSHAAAEHDDPVVGS